MTDSILTDRFCVFYGFFVISSGLSRPNFLTAGYCRGCNDLYTPIKLLQGAPDERRQADQREPLGVELAPPPARHLCEDPALMHPHIEQDKGQGNQYEAIGRILGGRLAAHLPRAAIAGLDAKAPLIELTGVAGREVQMDQNEEQPLRPPLESPSCVWLW